VGGVEPAISASLQRTLRFSASAMAPPHPLEERHLQHERPNEERDDNRSAPDLRPVQHRPRHRLPVRRWPYPPIAFVDGAPIHVNKLLQGSAKSQRASGRRRLTVQDETDEELHDICRSTMSAKLRPSDETTRPRGAAARSERTLARTALGPLATPLHPHGRKSPGHERASMS